MKKSATAILSLLSVVAVVNSTACGGGSMNSLNNNLNEGPVGASVSGTIAVGITPVSVVVDSTTANKIYVVDFGTRPALQGQSCSPSGADIEEFDGGSLKPTASAGFGSGSNTQTPFAAALDTSNHTLYVLANTYWTGFGHATTCGLFLPRMDSFDTTSLTEGSSMLGLGAGIDVNPTNGNIYIAGWEGKVAVFTATGGTSPTTLMAAGTGPKGIAVNVTTNKIYVANTVSGDVSVIDGATNSVMATIKDPLAEVPVAVGINPVLNRIYIVNSGSNNLTVVDGATDTVTITIPVGTSPSGVAVDPQSQFIYVANAGDAKTGDPGSVTVINGETNATTTLTDPSAKNPAAIAANPTTNKIYVANSGSNNVTVIDGAHN